MLKLSQQEALSVILYSLWSISFTAYSQRQTSILNYQS